MSKKRFCGGAMAFHHSKGFVAAFKQASRFAGKDGRIGTLPDIINARLSSNPGPYQSDLVAWERYFTTLSAEYFGVSRGGNKILIVAHGVGPMSTLEGVLLAYKYEYEDRNRNRRGGRINRELFWQLESGHFGPVEVVDFNSVLSRYKYPFLQSLTAMECQVEPLLKARFGPRHGEYIRKHVEVSREWHKEQKHGHKDNPYILKMGYASNCSYMYKSLESDLVMAHLLSIGGLTQSHHDRDYSLMSDVNCHEWGDGVRLLGLKSGASLFEIHSGPSVSSDFIACHWQRLMRPTGLLKQKATGFYVLQALQRSAGNVIFTQYPKAGPGLDTCEPQYLVTATEPLGQPVEFETEILGYKMFFKYDIRDVQRLAPPRANAYMIVGEPVISRYDNDEASHQKVMVQFYWIEADLSQQMLRDDEIENNFDLQMQLLEA